MILRNGINSTLRAKGRTVLFTLLILTLTVTLTLGMGMWAYSSQTLAQMDKSYTSVALVEYMGNDYPNPDAADPLAREAMEYLDVSALSAIEGVKQWEYPDRTLAVVDGYKRSIGTVPYPNNAVLECMSFVPHYVEGTVAYTEDQLTDSYLAVSRSNNTAKRQFSWHLSTDWIPYYEYIDLGGGEKVYAQLNDIFVYESTDESDLPSEYIAGGSWTDTGAYVYRYVKDGIITVYTLNVYSGREVYEYDPVEDLYYGRGKIIEGYSALCADVLYAYGKSDNLAITITSASDFVPEAGKHYLLHGTFLESGRNNEFILTDFYEGCEVLPYQEVNQQADTAIFYEYAELYKNANNAVNVEASSQISALEIFQQNHLTLMEGRFPETGESGVCVVTWDMAQAMELSLGSTISMLPMHSQEDNRYNLARGENSRSLTVIGITNTSQEYFGSIWVTEKDGNFGNPLFGYELGRAVLDNKSARSAADAIQAVSPANVRVTLYDQGYAAAAQPLQTMETTAMAVTIASVSGAVAVLLLFAFLFVGRQRETVQVLVSLGTPTGKIRLWLLSGATLISGVAALAGATIGGSVLEKIIHVALQIADSLYATDRRYSESAVGYIQESVLEVAVPMWPAVLAGLSVFFCALILCTLFLSQAKRQSVPKRGKQSVRVPKSGTSVACRGALRFALLSTRRGGWRSTIVPAATLVLSLLLGILATGAEGWSNQLDSVYDNTVISGEAVSNNGRQSNNLVISTEDARLLWESGYLDNIHVSIGWHYWMWVDMPEFSPTSFGQERRMAWIKEQPELIAISGLSAASEFAHSQAPEITWLSGWDESFLNEKYPSFLTAQSFNTGRLPLPPELEPVTYPCLVSESYLASHDLTLGGTYAVSMLYKYAVEDRETYIQIMPVGTFQQPGADANIYVPLSFWCDYELIIGEEYPYNDGSRPNSKFTTYEGRDRYFYTSTTFDTCSFALKETKTLDSFRDYLQDSKISQVRKLAKNRMTIVLRDQTFTETVGGLGRYISFSKILFPALFAIVCLLGFIISWLMVNGRRMEFAILHGLGASRQRVFWSIFLEQILLCLLGCLLSSGVLYLINGPGSAQWFSVLVFLGCYLAGCAVSVIVVSKTNLMLLLSERE